MAGVPTEVREGRHPAHARVDVHIPLTTVIESRVGVEARLRI